MSIAFVSFRLVFGASVVEDTNFLDFETCKTLFFCIYRTVIKFSLFCVLVFMEKHIQIVISSRETSFQSVLICDQVTRVYSSCCDKSALI